MKDLYIVILSLFRPKLPEQFKDVLSVIYYLFSLYFVVYSLDHIMLRLLHVAPHRSLS